MCVGGYIQVFFYWGRLWAIIQDRTRWRERENKVTREVDVT